MDRSERDELMEKDARLVQEYGLDEGQAEIVDEAPVPSLSERRELTITPCELHLKVTGDDPHTVVCRVEAIFTRVEHWWDEFKSRGVIPRLDLRPQGVFIKVPLGPGATLADLITAVVDSQVVGCEAVVRLAKERETMIREVMEDELLAQVKDVETRKIEMENQNDAW